MRPLELSALLALTAMSSMACADPPQHIYSARRYSADTKCLGPYESLDLVISDRGGEAKCAPICLTLGDDVYVSIVCGPYPEAFDVSGKSPVCREALAAPRCDDVTGP